MGTFEHAVRTEHTVCNLFRRFSHIYDRGNVCITTVAIHIQWNLQALSATCKSVMFTLRSRGLFYERVVNLCYWLHMLLAYDGRNTKMALETGPSGTRFQSNHRATNVVSLWWETTLHGLFSEVTYDVINLWRVHKTETRGPFYERVLNLRRRKCDDLPLAYDGHRAMMALETGPIGTRIQSNHCATTFVSLWWKTTLLGLISEITYDVINSRHVHKTLTTPHFMNIS